MINQRLQLKVKLATNLPPKPNQKILVLHARCREHFVYNVYSIWCRICQTCLYCKINIMYFIAVCCIRCIHISCTLPLSLQVFTSQIEQQPRCRTFRVCNLLIVQRDGAIHRRTSSIAARSFVMQAHDHKDRLRPVETIPVQLFSRSPALSKSKRLQSKKKPFRKDLNVIFLGSLFFFFFFRRWSLPNSTQTVPKQYQVLFGVCTWTWQWIPGVAGE